MFDGLGVLMTPFKPDRDTYDHGLHDGQKYAEENPHATEAQDDTRFEQLPGGVGLWQYRQGFYHGVKMTRNEQLLNGQRPD